MSKRLDSRPRSSSLLALALGLVSLSSGCAGRAHLTESYGRATRTALASQAVNPDAGNSVKPNLALDAQEASIIVQNYRRALTAKGTQAADEGLVVVGTQRPAQPYIPPPSVPQGQR